MPPREASHKNRKMAVTSVSVAEIVGRSRNALRSKKLEMEKRVTTNPQSKIDRA
jgi:phage regulator Rha-like protein